MRTLQSGVPFGNNRPSLVRAVALALASMLTVSGLVPVSVVAATAGALVAADVAADLTTTSSYHPADIHDRHLAEFGVFASDSVGPGVIANTYASNMANAAFYVGACQQSCDTVLTHDRGTNSALGYLGTNSGGRISVTSSVFDRNRTGIALLSLNTDDLPPPQDGRCPDSATKSCTLFEHNVVRDNNNVNAPAFGINPAIGVGIEISGGRFDTITANTITGNESWGILVNDSVDALSTHPQSHCQGGIPNLPSPGACLFTAIGNRIFANSFDGNGTLRNPTNGDIGTFSVAAVPPVPRNCFYSNRAQHGRLVSSPSDIESSTSEGLPCDKPGIVGNTELIRELRCADGGRCAIPGARYPKPVSIDYVGLPSLSGMPDPCASVPKNPYCSTGRFRSRRT